MKTEKEKMLDGELYQSMDPVLTNERTHGAHPVIQSNNRNGTYGKN